MPDTDTIERKIMDEQKPKYVPYELKGRAIKNSFKKKDTEPDMKGEIMYKGQHIRFGMWLNEGQYGAYYSIKVSDPDWQPKPKTEYPREVSKKYDSDVPW